MVSWLKGPISNFKQLRKLSRFDANGDAEDVIWALKDLSFEVKQGEVVGIVGRNGAGKSTLLKVISRITGPTFGRVLINGRISSLLEVGTGFHLELTGRENVYLNGAVLGMSKQEIDRKFDEIVAFAEVEKFIDTPVKRYSSGMLMRLAFAVAAHLEPEVLLIDEVLAVGDVAFQKKCLGKMEAVAEKGRTVLFVSHNMAQIKRLCTRGLWISDGTCLYDGPVDDAVIAYQRSLSDLSTSTDSRAREPNFGFINWKFVNSEAGEPHLIRTEGPVTLEVSLRLKQAVSDGDHSLVLKSWDGQNVGGWRFRGFRLSAGFHKITYTFPNLPLRPGLYFWYVALWNPRKVDEIVFPQEMVVATPDHSDQPQHWAGILNMPLAIDVKTLD